MTGEMISRAEASTAEVTLGGMSRLNAMSSQLERTIDCNDRLERLIDRVDIHSPNPTEGDLMEKRLSLGDVQPPFFNHFDGLNTVFDFEAARLSRLVARLEELF